MWSKGLTLCTDRLSSCGHNIAAAAPNLILIHKEKAKSSPLGQNPTARFSMIESDWVFNLGPVTMASRWKNSARGFSQSTTTPALRVTLIPLIPRVQSDSSREIQVTTEEMKAGYQKHKPEAKLLMFCLYPNTSCEMVPEFQLLVQTLCNFRLYLFEQFKPRKIHVLNIHCVSEKYF